MATRPSLQPRWADSGGSIVQPTSAKKDVGWVGNEKPPAPFMNWLLNLIYLWILYFDDRIIKPKTFNDDPLWLYQNQLGDNRTVVDHNGYLTARNTIIDELWLGAPIGGVSATYQESILWTTVNVGSGNVDNNNIINGAVGLQISSGASASDYGSIYSTTLVNLTSYMSLVVEWEAYLNVATAGNNVIAQMGLTDGSVFSAADPGAWFQKLAADSTWFVVTSNGSSAHTPVDTTVTATNTAQNFRIEWHGPASPYGANTARFFVNGTLTAVVTLLPAAGDFLNLMFYLQNTTGAARFMYVSPVRVTYNRLLTSPPL